MIVRSTHNVESSGAADESVQLGVERVEDNHQNYRKEDRLQEWPCDQVTEPQGHGAERQ
jgi:hypothetical protein